MKTYTIRQMIIFLKIAMMMVGWDQECGAKLFKCDPAGFFVGYKATSSGTKSQESLNHLEKKLKKDPLLSDEETIEVWVFFQSWLTFFNAVVHHFALNCIID